MRRNHMPLFALIAFLLIGFVTAGAFAQESGSFTVVGPGPPQVLSGEIRWKKALGTVPFVAGLSAAHSDPCSAFHILVVTATQEQKLLNYTDALTWKPDAGEFNVCKFKTTAPSNLPIRVYAAMGKKDGSTELQDSLYLHGGWSGGEKIPYDSYRYGWARKGQNFYPGNLIDPQPETGYKRGFGVGAGSYEVTLGNKGTYLKFEMIYISNRFGNFKYTEPAPPPLKPPFIITGQVIIQPYVPFASVYLGWDGGPDHPSVDVWVSIDNGVETPAFSTNYPPQHPVFKQAKVAGIELKLTRHRLYKFVLKDAGKTLSTASVAVP